MATPMNYRTLGAEVGPPHTLAQILELCRQAWNLDIKLGPDGQTFAGCTGHHHTAGGILAATAQIMEDNIIQVRALLLQGPATARVTVGAFCQHLSALSDKIRLAPPIQGRDGVAELWAELSILAVPLSLSRESALLQELVQLQEMAKLLQAELPQVPVNREQLQQLYKEAEGVLEPILPWAEVPTEASLQDQAREVMDYLFASCSVALIAPDILTLELALSECARAAAHYGQSLGRFVPMGITSQKLLELAHKAPGLVVVPAVRLSLGINVYELSNEIQNLLTCLSQQQRPVLFTGSRAELQAIFHGGQGGVNDPLRPVVCQVPEVSRDTLVRFAVDWAGQLAGGLPPAASQALVQEVADLLAKQSPADSRRLLPLAALRMVRLWANGLEADPVASQRFAAQAVRQQETLGGLSPRSRAQRSDSVQQRYTRVLTDPGLLDYFREHLVGQDEALAELVARLQTEALTRPWHQPMRYFAQGLPGTGKSESAQLLARRLGVPFHNIDCAGFPNFYVASAQLLGSGRGIVGSYQAGRLEMVAKHHDGVVLEVSDLDHAPPEVRGQVADLFLQMLDRGEAQAASGAVFPCPNLILVFTMNLPDGKDEKVFQGIGFTAGADPMEVQQRVQTELKVLLSNAFLSRIGSPILFRPLSGDALAAIVEQAVRAACREALARLQHPVQDVILAPGLGSQLLASLSTPWTASGARALQDHGRRAAALAVSQFLGSGRSPHKDAVLQVALAADGMLRISL